MVPSRFMRVSSFYRAFTPFVTNLHRSTNTLPHLAARPPVSLLASLSGGATNQTFASASTSTTSAATMASQEAYDAASAFGFSDFECWLTTGGDDRSLILKSGANKVCVVFIIFTFWEPTCICVCVTCHCQGVFRFHESQMLVLYS